MADRLESGQSLQVNESLTSAGGEHSLVLQEDGNLVLYTAGQEPVWATGTDGQEVATATMQEDGNFVLYAPGGEAIWASGTDGSGGATLVLQDDRNLVIYDASGGPVWASDTSA